MQRQMVALAAQLQREHRAIAHDALEEGPGGLYALCDALAGADALAVVARLRAQPSAPLSPRDRPAPVW